MSHRTMEEMNPDETVNEKDYHHNKIISYEYALTEIRDLVSNILEEFPQDQILLSRNRLIEFLELITDNMEN